MQHRHSTFIHPQHPRFVEYHTDRSSRFWWQESAPVLQEPRHVDGLPGATIPTTLTYFARVIPQAETPLNIDFGVAQIANRISLGVELKVRSQFATGISYRF